MKPVIKYTLGTVARILSGLLLVCMTIGAWAGWINPQVWTLPAVLCLIFPMLWFTTLVVALLWTFLTKEKVTATVCGTFLLVTLPQLFNVSPVSFPSKPGENERTFKYITYNVANAKEMDSIKLGYSRSISYIINSGADIVCLQEYHDLEKMRGQGSQITDAQVDSLKKAYPYQLYEKNVESWIFSKYPATYEDCGSWKTKRFFNYMLGSIDIDGYKIHILNVHLSSYNLNKKESQIASSLKHEPGEVFEQGQDSTLYNKLRKAFCERARVAHEVVDIIKTVSGPLIVSGDFNDVPNSYTWRTIKDAGLVDAYVKAGFGPMITFNADHFLFHIDQVLYRPDEGLRAFKIKRGYSRSSDHYPLIVDFAIKKDTPTDSEP
ncbi:MAG: hypothetical protein NC217_04275 [Muribaculaceae bacterium]|nr:hypothetical protein [Muribaculaceae bacterium]